MSHPTRFYLWSSQTGSRCEATGQASNAVRPAREGYNAWVVSRMGRDIRLPDLVGLDREERLGVRVLTGEIT